ncbi:MAG TPA: GGDEF domain-containing protein, partial [Burkholderiaceae bacterium]|nr:GGDEF domain-containing protein [Burkholderiaceae bacterium]
MMRPNSSGKSLGFVAMLIVGSVLTLLAIGQVMQRAVQTQLESEAEYAAMHWASFMRDTVPDLEAAFAGEGFTPDAQRQLQQLRRATEVFRFRLFDVGGAQLLASDDLEHEAPLGRMSLEEAALAGLHHDPAAVRAAESRRHVVELRRLDDDDESKVYSNAYVPLLQGQRLIGVVQFSADQTAREHRIAEAFRGVALTVAALLLALAGVGMWHRVQRARLQHLADERMRYLAQHDALTGVLNRTSFHEALHQAQARAEDAGRPFAVLCIDLDRFKDVNELLGPAGGDEILRAMARRLQQLQGGGDLLARLEGDRFAVLQTAVRGADDVASLGQRIIQALAQPYEVAGQVIVAGASAGAAVYGTDGRDRNELLHKADLALYRAKSGGRGVFSFYDASLDEKVQARRIIARELRQAMHADQLSLHYQPLYER